MRKILTFGMIFILLASLALATTTETWTDSYTDDIGLKTLAYKDCGLGGASADWTTASWTDDSANTTSCVDLAKCRTSANTTGWGAYSTTAVSGVSVALEGQYIQCQWNLTNTTSSQCNVSGFGVVCGGYNQDYDSSDASLVLIDGAVKVGVLLVAFASIIGLLLLFRWFKKNR